MKQQFERSALLMGEEGVERLSRATVAVFGIGGVGGYAVEALARAGVGRFLLCDNDTVSESNLNRQLIALHSTVGKPKTEVAKARILDINPDAKVDIFNMFLLPETAEQFPFGEADYVVDAIDTVSGKMEIYRRAAAAGVPVIAAMGTGNRMDAEGFTVTYIEKTEGCPLARQIRLLCRREGIKHLKVVYSPKPTAGVTLPPEHGRHAPGSVSFVPGVAGLLLAGEVVRDLLKTE